MGVLCPIVRSAVAEVVRDAAIADLLKVTATMLTEWGLSPILTAGTEYRREETLERAWTDYPGRLKVL